MMKLFPLVLSIACTLAASAAWAKEYDRPILLGEFGAYDKAPQPSRLDYTAAVARAAEKRGWAWTCRQFDSNFIVYHIDKDAWNEPVYHALVPP
jgi:endoglucanase